ncbi:MAG TPA: cation:proton antiporter [Thermoanaerobaculia bacterium]|nr:cation:proton antiporter [Thermoanaerobaculia bacterium]
MTHAPPFLAQVVALVVAAALIAYVCSRLRILPIVGFLIAGVVIGPNALGLVKDAALIDSMAEIGIVLLLFTLGIEFSLDRVWRIKRAIFVGGGLQVGLTVVAVIGVLALFGIGWRTGFYTGAIVALSSTALVLRVLSDRNELTSSKGQLALGILIFQDLSIVALALILPLLAGEGGSGSDAARSLAIAAVVVAVIVVVTRRVMPFVLERVARTCSAEIFLLTIIAICFGTAWLTSLAGVSLSLGAFLAGLVVSESRFSHHAFAEILPLQILFSAIFFVSVGLLLDLSFVAHNLPLILAVVAAVVLLKVLVTLLAARLLGYGWAVAGATALLLAQIGEFSFVLERVGRSAGLYPAGMEGMGQTFIASAVLLMAVTPLLARAGSWLESLRARHADESVGRAAEAEPSTERVQLENHVIVAGYGSSARYLTRVLRDSGVPFVILTLSPTGATEAQRDGLRVVLGDYSRRFLLDVANVDAAKMLVIPDDTADMAQRVVAVARGINPTLQIVVRTHSASDVDALLHEGADQVLVDELEIGVQLFTTVLSEYRVSDEEIGDHVDTVRAGGYAALRAGIADVPLVVCDDLNESCFDTRTFTVRRDTAERQVSLGELTSSGGLKVISVERNGEVIPAADDLVLAAGDRLTARASAQAFAAAARLLRPASVESEAPAPARAEVRTVMLTEEQRSACAHGAAMRAEVTTAAAGCEECLKSGDTWVHLRICMKCGRVGCCDSSKNRHATRHYEATTHPIIRSWQPGETWAWCYPDERML